MGLENPTYISDFITTNPPQTDLRREGDDHLRRMKQATLNTFPAITGAVLASHAELNLLVGKTTLPQVVIFSPTLVFSSALAPGGNRTFVETVNGVLASDVLLPVPGAPWSSYPGLLISACAPSTNQISVTVINAGALEIPVSTSLLLPFATIR